MARERDESGQYVETVEPEDVLEVFGGVRGPAITSRDVADALDCTTEAARQKLKQLRERGVVDSRKTGRTVVWWRVDDAGGAHKPESGVRISGAGRDADRAGDRADPGADRVDADVDVEAASSIDEALAGWRPGRGAANAREQRREIGRRALAWLRDGGGPASRSDFEAALYEDHHLDDQGPDAWWRRLVRPALDRAGDAGLVEYSHGRHEYRWVGPAPAGDDDVVGVDQQDGGGP